MNPSDIQLTTNVGYQATDILFAGSSASGESSGSRPRRIQVFDRFGRFGLKVTLAGRGVLSASTTVRTAPDARHVTSTVETSGSAAVASRSAGAGLVEAGRRTHIIPAAGSGELVAAATTSLTVASAGDGRANDDDLILALL